MNKGFLPLLALGFVMIVGLLGFLFSILSIKACSVSALLLDQSVFPPGTNSSEFYAPIPDELTASDSASRTFLLPPGNSGRVMNDVYYYGWNRWAAAQTFRDYLEGLFSTDLYRGPWEAPEALSYSSTVANQYHFACDTRNPNNCQMIAQYGSYFEYLVIDMPQELVMSDLENLLRKADEKMIDCIGK